MNEEKLAQYREMLEAELKTVERELESLAKPDIDHSATEKDEVADRLEDQEESEEESAALTARRGDIVLALDKIEDGTYGKCEEGGEEIESDRLEANPAARTCKKHM